MVDYIGLAGLIIGILGALGACATALHIKLKSNCCDCIQLECIENNIKRRDTSSTPPRSPTISEPKDLRKLEDATTV
jgi:hypothetical protein